MHEGISPPPIGKEDARHSGCIQVLLQDGATPEASGRLSLGNPLILYTSERRRSNSSVLLQFLTQEHWMKLLQDLLFLIDQRILISLPNSSSCAAGLPFFPLPEAKRGLEPRLKFRLPVPAWSLLQGRQLP